MTSDAKLGLLFGLILIIAIVFALNGLPGVIRADGTDSNEGEVIRVATEDIMSTARETIQSITPQKENFTKDIPPQPSDDVQFVRSFENNAQTDTQPAPTKIAQNDVYEYTVQANDNLAVIAKKFYGQEEGNRIVNIKKIAEFNKLKSDNFIFQGQKLKIPPLNKAQQSQFAKVENFGDRISNGIRNIIPLPTISVTNQTASGFYVVRTNDTLWSIAQQQLGNGSRYHEILKANPNISDADELETGMKLKIPGR